MGGNRNTVPPKCPPPSGRGGTGVRMGVRMTLRLGALGLLCGPFLGTDEGTCPPLVVGGGQGTVLRLPPKVCYKRMKSISKGNPAGNSFPKVSNSSSPQNDAKD